MGFSIQIEPLGDAAVILRVGEARISPAQALPQLLAIQHQLQRAAIPGVTEVTTASTTVAVFYDPVVIHDEAGGIDSVFDWLQGRILEVLSGVSLRDNSVKLPARLVEIPVCYAPEFAPDLAEVARQAQLANAEVVRRHSAVEYVVQCIGFTPGFPYLGGLPPELVTPRRARPRSHVPAGSVAIGGSQAGIYPLPSPGGWNVIGRTPLQLFSVKREEPALLRAGDRVRFHPISAEEFHASHSRLQSAANK